MRILNRLLLSTAVYRNAENEVGGGGGESPTPESVLFPAENDDGKGGQGDSDKGGGDRPAGDGDKPADWKEYEPDPNKTEAENAAAKAEHDKAKPADKSDPLDTVPQDGKYTLTMPEGVQVDQELLDALSPKFAGKKMTTREAQELADEFIKVQREREEGRVKQWSETVDGWVTQAKADKDIGGDKWDGTVKHAQRAVRELGTPALKEYLEATGGGNHPELIRFMAKVGGLIREDDPAGGGAEGRGKPAEAAHIIFPSDAPKG